MKNKLLPIAASVLLAGCTHFPELADIEEEFDAAARLGLELRPADDPPGCRCAEVLLGELRPRECSLFGQLCTPEDPVGPCMVSSEGTCAAWYRYARVKK